MYIWFCLIITFHILSLPNTYTCTYVGDTPISYVWTLNGVEVGTGQDYTITSVDDATEGDYACLVQTSSGVVSSRTARIQTASKSKPESCCRVRTCVSVPINGTPRHVGKGGVPRNSCLALWRRRRRRKLLYLHPKLSLGFL